MAHTRQSIYRLIIALLTALVVAHIITLFSEYFYLYSRSDGFRLPNNKPVGGDFVTFYQAGKMFRNESNLIYNFDYYLDRQLKLYMKYGVEEGKLIFAYPPLVAGFLA